MMLMLMYSHFYKHTSTTHPFQLNLVRLISTSTSSTSLGQVLSYATTSFVIFRYSIVREKMMLDLYFKNVFAFEALPTFHLLYFL